MPKQLNIMELQEMRSLWEEINTEVLSPYRILHSKN